MPIVKNIFGVIEALCPALQLHIFEFSIAEIDILDRVTRDGNLQSSFVIGHDIDRCCHNSIGIVVTCCTREGDVFKCGYILHNIGRDDITCKCIALSIGYTVAQKFHISNQWGNHHRVRGLQTTSR